MEFEFGNFRDGEIKFAKTELNGFVVEYQGWNSSSQPYDRVLVIHNNEIVLSKNVNLFAVKNLRRSDVELLINEAKEALKK